MAEIEIKFFPSHEHSVRLEARYENKARIYSAIFRRIGEKGGKCIASCKRIKDAFGSETNRDAKGRAVKIPWKVMKEMKEKAKDMLRFNLSSHYMNIHESASSQLPLRLF